MDLLKKIAVKTHRTAEDARRIADRSAVRAKYVLLTLFAVAFGVLFVPVITQQMSDWSSSSIQVAIPPESWKVIYHQAKGPCADNAFQNESCPANPNNAELWQSAESRADERHIKRVQEIYGKEFWIGTSISVDTLKKAHAARANNILLGYIRATYRIWVDGQFRFGGTRKFIEPIIIQVPMERLARDQPLHLAIQIYYDVEHPYPDFLQRGYGGEGFVSYSNIVSYQSFASTLYKARPFSLFIANILIASLFFLLWGSSKIKQEYFYMAMYCLINGVEHLLLIDLIQSRLDLGFFYGFNNTIRFLEGAFGLLLGLAFARTRRVFFQVGVPIAIVVPALIQTLLAETSSKFYFSAFQAKWLIPSFFLLGTFTCFIQAYYLFGQRRTGAFLPVRIRRLVFFGIGLAAIAALNVVVSHALISATNHLYWERFIHLLLVGFLAKIVFNEYYDQSLMIEKTPVSEYHKRPVLPSKISGTILVADLKSSEFFYKHRASNGEKENLVSIWRSYFYTSILKYNGFVIHKKGDEVIGFFDSDKCPDHTLSAVNAVKEMAQLSALLEQDFRSRNMYPSDAKEVCFRAALTTGDVKPVWEEMGKSREAYWEEAGNTSPFVESSRLLEIERSIAHPSSIRLIVPEKLVNELIRQDPELRVNFVLRSQIVKSKHDSSYEVAVFVPLQKNKVKLLKIAA